MKNILLPVLFSVAVAVCRADGPYHLIKEIPVGGDGGWDGCSLWIRRPSAFTSRTGPRLS